MPVPHAPSRRTAHAPPVAPPPRFLLKSIPTAFQVLLAIADNVFAIEKHDVLRAGEIAQNPARLSARDALHIAIMERHGIRSILSFDAGFDRWPGIHRIHRI